MCVAVLAVGYSYIAERKQFQTERFSSVLAALLRKEILISGLSLTGSVLRHMVQCLSTYKPLNPKRPFLTV